MQLTATKIGFAVAFAATITMTPVLAQSHREGGYRGAGASVHTRGGVGSSGIHSSERIAPAASVGASPNFAVGNRTRFSRNQFATNNGNRRHNYRNRGDHRLRSFGAGFATGALLGSGFGYGAYGYPYGFDDYAYADDGYYGADDGYYGDDAYAEVPEYSGDSSQYCAQRYQSYDPASGTYLGYDGMRHPCP